MSNPTSNFNWQMPTATDLVTDLPADFEVFGQAVDTSLADLKGGTTGQVLKKNTDADMDFVWAADAAGMTNPMTTTGDTIYSSSGSTPARLGIGSTGNVLTVSGGVPVWAAPAGGGKIAQVVQGTTTTDTNTTSTSYVNTSLSVSITPSSATSKVMLFVMGSGQARSNSTNGYTWAEFCIANNTTTLKSVSIASYNIPNSSTPKDIRTPINAAYLDSPATTSAITYRLRVRVNSGGSQSGDAALTVGDQIIVAMEVLA